ncbi:type II pantothenate kinase [Neobacillus dielmonensis]|uniref:type II pantothenate kinase n=1 Tax=Neobacillus dielmonensis TaxID=1347369 RepID=UPI0005A8469C|nr:type II pantothenate kinase [Neobacillus dielmonensis]
MSKVKAGIDAGGSLLKIAYKENNRIHFKKFPIEKADVAISWVKAAGVDVQAVLTGGKAHILQKNYFPDATIVPEFQATCDGARFLLAEQGAKVEDSFLIINIGTGTSWHLVKGENYERILGSGLGGGTFVGLGSLLANSQDYDQLTSLASKGSKGNLDLLVKDIYESDESPINGDLTAANFAKAAKVMHSEADRMAAVTNMIAETIILLTLQAAALHKVKDIVLIGSTLLNNPFLKTTLENYLVMLGLTPVFVANGEFSSSYGALLSV